MAISFTFCDKLDRKDKIKDCCPDFEDKYLWMEIAD